MDEKGFDDEAFLVLIQILFMTNYMMLNVM